MGNMRNFTIIILLILLGFGGVIGYRKWTALVEKQETTEGRLNKLYDLLEVAE